MEIRPLALAELCRATEIDVTEHGTTVLEQGSRDVSTRPETWSRPPRPAERRAEGEEPAEGRPFGRC